MNEHAGEVRGGEVNGGEVDGTPSASDVVEAHRAAPVGPVWGIAELSKEFGVSPRAIRFYETKGLLSPGRANGTRIYSRRDRARLALILRAKRIGSSLAEIKHYLDLYGERGEGRTKQLDFVIDKTAEAIRELEARREQLDRMLEELRVVHAYSVKRRDERKG